jgi:cellulose synthase/poly-beta-1,6-N-acetylglucosamine synthase-like glycosyltransferase
MASTILSTLSLIGSHFFAPTVIAQFCYILIFGITIGPRCFLSYVWAMELTPKDKHSFYSTMAMLFDSLCMIFLGVYFWVSRSMEELIVGLAAI